MPSLHRNRRHNRFVRNNLYLTPVSGYGKWFFSAQNDMYGLASGRHFVRARVAPMVGIAQPRGIMRMTTDHHSSPSFTAQKPGGPCKTERTDVHPLDNPRWAPRIAICCCTGHYGAECRGIPLGPSGGAPGSATEPVPPQPPEAGMPLPHSAGASGTKKNAPSRPALPPPTR